MKVDWEQREELRSPDGVMVRHIAFGQQLSCLRVQLPAGLLGLSPHWHDNEQWIVVTHGSVRFACDDQEYELNEGDIAYIPSGHPHTATGAGPDGAVLYEMSTPPRLDLVGGSLVPSVMRYESP